MMVFDESQYKEQDRLLLKRLESAYDDGYRAGVEDALQAYYDCPDGEDPDNAIRRLLAQKGQDVSDD